MATFLKGDCLEMMKGLPSGSVDCFIVDLPYGQLSKDTERADKACGWDVKIDLSKFWVEVKRLCKDSHTPVIMFCNTRFGIDLINSNPSWFRYDLVWDKGHGVSFLLANKMPMKSHEMIYIFSKAGAHYNRIDVEKPGAPAWATKDKDLGKFKSVQYGVVRTEGSNVAGKRCPLSVIDIKGKFAGGHPTEKPVELYKWLIERYSDADGVILDPTAGSFNSCLAALELGRKCIGIEKDDSFFWTGVNKLNRWKR